jgi:hypothetical protein
MGGEKEIKGAPGKDFTTSGQEDQTFLASSIFYELYTHADKKKSKMCIHIIHETRRSISFIGTHVSLSSSKPTLS